MAGAGKPIVGGHHDAGDYGRYTYNSAQVAHILLFAGDFWFGSDKPDCLAPPESGDGFSDLHQIALIELDFLLQMQRVDGSFWGRISPRDRAYDSDVPAENSGPQRVQEGSSAATAAAVAVLYQASRSEYVKRTWPRRAKDCGAAAERGWSALKRLEFEKANHHYGDVFEDFDERLWAGVERSLALGSNSLPTLTAEARRTRLQTDVVLKVKGKSLRKRSPEMPPATLGKPPEALRGRSVYALYPFLRTPHCALLRRIPQRQATTPTKALSAWPSSPSRKRVYRYRKKMEMNWEGYQHENSSSHHELWC